VLLILLNVLDALSDKRVPRGVFELCKLFRARLAQRNTAPIVSAVSEILHPSPSAGTQGGLACGRSVQSTTGAPMFGDIHACVKVGGGRIAQHSTRDET